MYCSYIKCDIYVRRWKFSLAVPLIIIQALGDIEIAMKVLSDGGTKSDVHPIDRHYQQLGCKMEVLEHSSDNFKVNHQIVGLMCYWGTD